MESVVVVAGVVVVVAAAAAAAAFVVVVVILLVLVVLLLLLLLVGGGGGGVIVVAAAPVFPRVILKAQCLRLEVSNQQTPIPPQARDSMQPMPIAVSELQVDCDKPARSLLFGPQQLGLGDTPGSR